MINFIIYCGVKLARHPTRPPHGTLWAANGLPPALPLADQRDQGFSNLNAPSPFTSLPSRFALFVDHRQIDLLRGAERAGAIGYQQVSIGRILQREGEKFSGITEVAQLQLDIDLLRQALAG